MNRLLSAAIALVFALAVASPCVQGQAQPPVDRTEILGRLAVGFSPSYIAYLVKTRGIALSPSAEFVDRVKQAGGTGILADSLPGAAVSQSNGVTQQAQTPAEHLAACAQGMHARDYTRVEKECRAAIRENPASEWPYRAVAVLLQYEPAPLPDDDPKGKARQAEMEALVLQASALTPTVTRDPGFPRAENGANGFEVTEAQQVKYALELLAIDEQNVPGDTGGQLTLLIYRNAFSQAEGVIVVPAPDAAGGIPVGLAARIRVEPDLASNHLDLATYYEGLAHDPQQAEGELREAIRLEPDAERPHAHLAVFYDRRRDFDGSLAELRELVRIAPFGMAERDALAHELEAAGHIPDAVKELKAMVALWPDGTEVSEALVTMCMNHNDHPCAIEELQRSLKSASVYFADESKFVDQYLSSELQLASLLDGARRFDAAAEQYQHILRFKPDDAQLHVEFGNVLADQRLCDRAIAEYNEALRLDPNMAIAHTDIGFCLEAKNDLDGAIGEFRQVSADSPYDGYTAVALGEALAQKGDAKAARRQFHEVLESTPNNADAHASFGHALFVLKDPEGGIKELRKALELEPDSADAQNGLAWIYCTAEDPKFRNPAECLALARKAVASSDIPNPDYIDTLAEALLQNGRAEEALTTELKAIEADPDNPQWPSRLAYFRTAADKGAGAGAGAGASGARTP